MSHRGGMPVSVQRALGVVERRAGEVVVCGCGTDKVFDFNAIGQMLEICPRCRTKRLYRAIRVFAHDEHEHHDERDA